MTLEEKVQIDGMTYFDMLQRVRFDPIGSSFFSSDTEAGKYAWAKWEQLCRDTCSSERVWASKSIGWGTI